MNKITPHLWYDTQAIEAANLYTAAFPGSRIMSSSAIDGTPSGSVDTVSIELAGQQFDMISAGPEFAFNPSISFLVACDGRKEVDAIWAQLADGGMALMELGEYPFSPWYGWTTDRYGVSWQVMDYSNREIRQKITPTLMFTGDVCGRAEEAMNLYVSVFGGEADADVSRYMEGEGPDAPGTVKHAGFTLLGQRFALMDSAHLHEFSFNEAISFMVHCEDQQEIDRYWNALSAEPEAEQCGWLKDRYGVSWQIVPKVLGRMMSSRDPDQIRRVTEAFLSMKKFDVSALERAYKG